MRSLVTKVLVLLFSKLATVLADCPMMYRVVGTVCGTDGVTYPSLCELEVAREFDKLLDIAYFGKCTTYCKDIWDPVCGNDLVTYSSLCLLEVEARTLTSLEVLHVGICCGGKDRESVQETPCKAMKINHSGDKGTQPSKRIEGRAKVEEDRLRIKMNKKVKAKKQKENNYADIVQEQWQRVGAISR